MKLNTQFCLRNLLWAVVWFCVACASAREILTADGMARLFLVNVCCCAVGASIGAFISQAFIGAALGYAVFYCGVFLVMFGIG